ncbi:MAG: hypothetical protein MJ175_09060, partial [Clostridia bacterium]|nr:hypothetical protein [Clostridia bacterium]
GAVFQKVSCLTGEEVTSSVNGGVLESTLPTENRAAIATVVAVTLDRPVKKAFEGFDPDTFDAYCK